MNLFCLWLTFFSLFFLGLADNVRGPVFPDFLRDFGLSDARGSLFFFVTSTFGLFCSLLAGIWLKRLGPYVSLRIFAAIQGLGLLGMGLAHGFMQMMVACAVFGVGLGGLGIAQNVLVGRCVTVAYRQRAYSALHSMYGAASLLAPLAVSGLVAAGYSWQSVFILLGIGSSLIFFASYFRSGPSTDETVAVLTSTSTPTGQPVKKGPGRAIVWVSLLLAAYVVAEIMISSRLVLLARRDFGLEVGVANRRLALFFILMLAGRLFFVFAPLKTRPLRLLWVSGASSLLFFVLGLVLGPTWLAFTGLAMAPFYPSAISYIQDEFGEEKDRAVTWSLTFVALGLMAMHPIVGALTDRFGLRAAMWSGPVCMVTILTLLALRPRQSVQDSPPRESPSRLG